MSLTQAQQMGMQQSGQSPYGGVALGHLPQQTDRGLGPNRYVPPTFDWGRGGLDGNQRQRDQMNWNQMQDYYLPNQGGQRSGPNQYNDALRQMLEQFSGQYGGAGRRPQLPQFSSYDPGFGGPTSYYDQQQQQPGRGGGRGGMGAGPGGRGGGRGGQQQQQFNPYQLMRGNLQGMGMDQMFPDEWAGLFGGQGFGSRTPNPRPVVTQPDLAAGNKPYPMPGG